MKTEFYFKQKCYSVYNHKLWTRLDNKVGKLIDSTLFSSQKRHKFRTFKCSVELNGRKRRMRGLVTSVDKIKEGV